MCRKLTMTQLLALFGAIAQTNVSGFLSHRPRANPSTLQVMIRGDPNGLQQPLEIRQTMDGLKTNLDPDNQSRRYETGRFLDDFNFHEQRRYDNWFYNERDNGLFGSRGRFDNQRRVPFRNGSRFLNTEFSNPSPQQQRPFGNNQQLPQYNSGQMQQQGRYNGRRPDEESFFQQRRLLEPYYNPRETSLWIKANPQRPTPLMPNEARYDAAYERQTRYESYRDGRRGGFFADGSNQQPGPRGPPRRPPMGPPDPRHRGRGMSNGPYDRFNGPRDGMANNSPQRMTQYRDPRTLPPAPAYRPFNDNGGQFNNNNNRGNGSMNQQRRFQQQHYRERESQFNNGSRINGSMHQQRQFPQQHYQDQGSPSLPPNGQFNSGAGGGGGAAQQQRRFGLQHYLEREKSSLAPHDQFNNGLINNRQSVDLFISRAGPPQNGSPPQFGTAESRTAVARQQVLGMVNSERSRQRLRPLRLDPYLNRAAQQGVELFRRDGKIDYNNSTLKQRVKATGYDNMDATKIDDRSSWKSWFTEIHVQGTDIGPMIQSLLTGRFRESLLSFQDAGVAYDNVLVITLGSIEFREKKPFAPEQRLNFANEVFRLTNVERNKHGLRPFVRSLQLDQSARLHAQDMYERGFYSHQTPEGESELQRIERTGYLNIDTIGAAHWTTATAENIAKGQETPEEVVRDWMESPDHRKNILSKEYEDLGVGVHGEHWVQNFGIKFVEYDAAYRDALKQLVETSQEPMRSAQTFPRGTLPEDISPTTTGRTRT